ncbi:MAG: hypothetical protein HKO76_00650, partial [Acidimicrobiia bacterium]|nr:hypothetical protein [Acidimicrobiia bacterium]
NRDALPRLAGRQGLLVVGGDIGQGVGHLAQLQGAPGATYRSPAPDPAYGPDYVVDSPVLLGQDVLAQLLLRVAGEAMDRWVVGQERVAYPPISPHRALGD